MAGQASNVLPAHEVFAYEDVPAGNAAELDAALPPHEISATGLPGSAGLLVQTLPAHELYIAGGDLVRAELPAHELYALGIVGKIGTADLLAPAHQLIASGFAEHVGGIVATLAAHRLSARGIVSVVGELDRVLPPHRLTAYGHSGRVGTIDLTLSAHQLAAAGGEFTVGQAYLLLPAHALEAFSVQSPAEHWRTWVVNTRKSALTEYDSWEHNSYAVFRGRVLAADATGVAELKDIPLDRGAPIDAYWSTGEHDFETSLMKRVPRIYAGGAFLGDLEFHTILPRDGTRKYLLQENGATGTQLRRVPVGQGPKSTYWQFAVANRAGADFTIDLILVFPETLRRRIG